MIENIRKIVEKDCTDWQWKYHAVIVVKYAKLLAKKFKVDEETIELAALLHDIGRFRHGGKDHEITGVAEAEKILKEHGYPKKVIDEVKHCVASHRGSKDVKPETLIAKIIANADAMSHFDIIPGLIKVGLKKYGRDIEKAMLWLNEKIERDWNKKLTIPEAKEMTKEKYDAFKLLVDSMLQYK